MKLPQSAVVILVLGCFVGTVAGCGEASQRAAVKGKVTVDGAPLPTGVIEFLPVDKQSGQPGGAAIEAGQYAISADKGLLAGEYLVQIRADRPTGKKVWDGMGDERWPASKKNFVDQMEAYIPARYNDRTELRARIESGKLNVYDFELQLGGKRGR
jgi:hypothetical protein